MAHFDESILSLRQQQKEQESGTEEGIYVKGSLVEFDMTEFYDGQILMLIPSKFNEMPLEIARIKYPSEFRPEYIFTSPDNDADIGLKLLDDSVSESDLESILAELKGATKAPNPSTEFFESDIEQLEDFKLAWYDYKSFAIDAHMYNILFAAPVDGKLLIGMFNCQFSAQEEWKKLAMKIIRSLRLNKEGE